ncbi:MAG: penicillin-binding protein 2 [Rickettsiaceae bacterium]|nr:penicillin-binding protein 2 [Rickettsiaceae bacterium]
MLDDEITRNHLITRRTFLLRAGKISLLSILIGRMSYLQLIKSNEYKILSDKNRISLIILPPARGGIKDRNGVIIAENRSSFFIKIDKRLEKNYTESAERLFRMLKIDEKSVSKILSKLKKSNKRIPFTIISDAAWEDIAKIEENISVLPGIYVEKGQIRQYKMPFSFCHVTGYVGRVAEDEMMESSQIPPEFTIGKTGVEKNYEDTLQGRAGYKKIEIDARGLFVRQVEKEDPISGVDIELTIDSRLQEHIYNILPPEGGSAIVMEINTGEIIACVSKGAFDPNEFASGISASSWQSLNSDQYKPLINKIAYSQYPPGSTFKLMTILAALEAGIPISQKFTCTGSIHLGNRDFNCWKKEGHGAIDMMNSIKHSCNCYMFNLSRLIGAESILNVAKRFGYGSPTNIDFPSEMTGFVPDRAWKLRRFKFDWSLGDSFNISIGQGALLATPIQLAVMTAGIASGKFLVKPRLAANAEVKTNLIDVKQEHLDFIRDAMYKAVHEEGGSCFASRSLIHPFAGKTGTAQVIAKKNANDDLSRANIDWQKRNHALFSGFTPIFEPKYAISIIIDHGGGGGRVAGPIAREISEFLGSHKL